METHCLGNKLLRREPALWQRQKTAEVRGGLKDEDEGEEEKKKKDERRMKDKRGEEWWRNDRNEGRNTESSELGRNVGTH